MKLSKAQYLLVLAAHFFVSAADRALNHDQRFSPDYSDSALQRSSASISSSSISESRW